MNFCGLLSSEGVVFLAFIGVLLLDEDIFNRFSLFKRAHIEYIFAKDDRRTYYLFVLQSGAMAME